MGNEIQFDLNDTYLAIAQVIADLKAFESSSADPRVKALVLTKLEEAQLWALRLVKPDRV